MNARTVILALGIAAVPAAAQAALVTETHSFGPGTPHLTVPLTFDRYHGNLADLISVRVSMTLNVNGGQLTVDNDGAGPAQVNVELGAQGTLSSMDVVLINSSFGPIFSPLHASTTGMFNLMGNVGDGIGDYDASMPDGSTLVGGSASDAQFGFVHPAFHSMYVGAGTFVINADADQILDFGSVGGVEGTFSPVNASGTVTVEYNVIPAPGAAALAGIGGLALMRRRR